MASNKSVVKKEPVVSVAVVVGVVVAIAAHFGVVIDPSTLMAAIASLGPLLTAIIARKFVTPVV